MLRYLGRAVRRVRPFASDSRTGTAAPLEASPATNATATAATPPHSCAQDKTHDPHDAFANTRNAQVVDAGECCLPSRQLEEVELAAASFSAYSSGSDSVMVENFVHAVTRPNTPEEREQCLNAGKSSHSKSISPKQ